MVLFCGFQRGDRQIFIGWFLFWSWWTQLTARSKSIENGVPWRRRQDSNACSGGWRLGHFSQGQIHNTLCKHGTVVKHVTGTRQLHSLTVWIGFLHLQPHSLAEACHASLLIWRRWHKGTYGWPYWTWSELHLAWILPQTEVSGGCWLRVREQEYK